ncbi:MAG: hypothetical protein WCY52_06690 [Sphaerochaetaceae bacterium]
MAKRYWIKDIAIRRAPGFTERTFHPVEGLSPQLNVIWGPNGIGKTTLAKSMRSVLWARDKSGELSVSALVKGREGEWRLELNQKRLVQRRLADNATAMLDGRNDSMESSYWLSLTNLLQAETRNKNFHEVLYNELHGGVDLDKATVEAGVLTKFATRGVPPYKALKEAREKITKIEKKQKDLEDLKEKIAKIKEELKKGDHFKDKVEEYERALEVKKLFSQIGELEQKLSNFDSRIDKVETFSYNRFVQLQEEVAEKRDELSLLIKEIEELEISLKESGIRSEQIGEHALVANVKNRLKEVQEAHVALQESRKELDKSIDGEAKWREEHSWLTSGLPDGGKLKGAVEQLKKLSQMYEPLRVRVAVSEELLNQLGAGVEFVDEEEVLGTLKQRVADGITTVSGEMKRGFPKKRGVIASLIIVLSVILALMISPWFSLGSLLGVFIILFQRRDKLNTDFTKIKKALEATSCPEPATWDLEGLGNLYLEVGKRLIQNNNLKEGHQRREVAQGNLERDQGKYQAWIEDWDGACKSLGLMKDQTLLDGAQFFHFSQHLLVWSQLLNDLAEKEGELKRNEANYKAALEALVKVIEVDNTSYIDLTSEAESFIERLQNAHQLTREAESKRKDKVRKVGDLKEREEKLNHFLESLDFTIDKVLFLKELSEMKSSWSDLRSELKGTRSQLEKFKSSAPSSVEIAIKESIETIEEELTKWRGKLEAREEKNQELGAADKEYELLLDSSDLANAEREYHLALEALEKLRDEQLVGMAVNILAQFLEEQSQQASNLEVLNKAEEWFKRITNRHYSVGINRDGFFAKDLIRKENLTLEQLSDATRLQLLFAVRMGFIEQQEVSSNRKFPIFMDELLANSDDSRALTIIEAVKEIAKERQVFYFTAQGDEVEKFRVHAKEVFNEVDLETIQRVQKAISSPLIESKPLVSKVSEPIDDYYEYGRRLDVAGASLWEEVEQLHIWHALLNSQDLYSYLEKGYSQIGQLDSNQRRIELIKRAQELARQGRPRKITLDDLRYGPVILNYDSAYWKQIEALFEGKEITGNTLIKALEDGIVKRLHKDTKDELIDYLVEESFATQEVPLTAEEVLSQIVRSEQLSPDSGDYKVVERYLSQVTSP